MADLYAWQRHIVTEAGDVIPDAEVEVRDWASGDIVDPLVDIDGNPITNPLNADSNGFAQFQVPVGQYDIQATGGGRTITWTKVLIGTATERAEIRRPEITSPADLAVNVPLGVTIEGTPYAPLYSVDARDVRRFQIIEDGGDFASPDQERVVDADSASFVLALSPDTIYQVRIRDEATTGEVSEWSTVVTFTTINTFVNQPTNVSPADEATGVLLTPELEADAFAVTGTTDTHVASQWQIFEGSTLVYDSGEVADLESHTPSVALDVDTSYFWQVRYKGDVLGLSQYSQLTSFQTADAFVDTPTLTVEGSPGDVPETPELETSAFSVTNGSDTHEATDWEVRMTADNSLVWSSYNDESNLLTIQVPPGELEEDTEYTFRARHIGETLGPGEFASVTATTEEEFKFSLTVITGTPTLARTGRAVTFDEDYVYVAHNVVSSGNRLTVIDKSDWSVVSGVSVNRVGLDIAVDDNYIYLVHFFGDGFKVLDKSDYSVVTDAPALPDHGYGVSLSDGRVYLAHPVGDGLTVLNISDWSAVSGTPTLPGSGRAIAVDDNYVYVGHSNPPFLTIYNKSTWAVVSGTPTMGSIVEAVAFDEDNIYVGERNSPYFSVFKKADWSSVSGTPNPGGWVNKIAVDQDYVYLAYEDDPYFAVVDKSDWSIISDTPALPDNGYGVAVDGDTVYLAHEGSPYFTALARD